MCFKNIKLMWLTRLFSGFIFSLLVNATYPPALASDGQNTHEPFIRLCYQLAIDAAQKGNHPFGALLVYEGKVILSSENTVKSANDFSRHAEMNLMVEAARQIPKDVLRNCTVYTSTYPCLACSQAILFRGISRIVYGVSLERFTDVMGYKKTGLTCEMLYKSLDLPLELVGPILEEEGTAVFKQWPKDDSHYAIVNSYFKKE